MGHERKFLSFGGSPELPEDEPDVGALPPLPLPTEPVPEPAEPPPAPAPAAAWERVISIFGLVAKCRQRVVKAAKHPACV